MSDRRKSTSSGSVPRDREHTSSETFKVAIPRLCRPVSAEEESIGTDSKQRVSHACEPCRQRKTKCSGEKPVCKHCQDFNINCFYADGKRDRARNELSFLKNKVELYEKLLDQVKGQLDNTGQALVTNALQSNYITTKQTENEDRANRDGESLVTAEVGSTGSVDHVTDDFTEEDPYPTGYMGETSEVAWIKRVAQQLREQAREESPSQFAEDDEYEFKTPTYRLDDLSISVSSGSIDPYMFPGKQVADRLVNAFFQSIWPTFPMISEEIFIKQYDAFYECYLPPGSSQRWLAMFNLVCAIGALYGQSINASWCEGEEHLNYFARARILSLDHGNIFEIADLQQVQLFGLAGIYLISCHQINRAFNTIGVAIRFAQTLALHLRNDVPDLSVAEKELRARIWYSLYAAEILVCCMTGRPSSVDDRDCSVSLDQETPSAQGEYQAVLESVLAELSEPSTETHKHSSRRSPLSTPQSHSSQQPQPPEVVSYSTYFYYHTKLNLITSKVLRQLYSPSVTKKSWSDVQGIISALELEILKWRNGLPPFLDFGNKQQANDAFVRQRLNLGFQYHNIRLLVNRPCLCRVDLRIPKESKRSKYFNRSAASTCIGSAREIVALLPNEPNPTELFSMSPWWSLHHYIVSAGTILLVEISMRAEHCPQQAEGLLDDAKKVLRWLHTMAEDDIAAERSWAILLKLLIVSAPKIGRDISDVERNLRARKHSTAMPVYPTANTRAGVSAPQTDPHRVLNDAEIQGMWPSHDVSDLFRDLINNPYSNVNNRGFDPLSLDMDEDHQRAMVAESTQPTLFGSDISAPTTSHDPNLVYSTLPPAPPIYSQVNTEDIVAEQEARARRRLVKRLSQGVNSIPIPPPNFNNSMDDGRC